jgi:hypothetical protein
MQGDIFWEVVFTGNLMNQLLVPTKDADMQPSETPAAPVIKKLPFVPEDMGILIDPFINYPGTALTDCGTCRPVLGFEHCRSRSYIKMAGAWVHCSVQ